MPACVSTCAQQYPCVQMLSSCRESSLVFFYLIHWSKVPQSNPELTDAASFPSELALIFCLQKLELQVAYHNFLAFYMSPGNPNSDPHKLPKKSPQHPPTQMFSDRVSLRSPGWPQAQDPPASASGMLGLQACSTMPGFNFFFWKLFLHSFFLFFKAILYLEFYIVTAKLFVYKRS